MTSRLDAATVRARLDAVRGRIARAADRAGRDPASIELVAVTKTHPEETLRALLEAGHDLFGENRVQELLAKRAAFEAEPPPTPARWRMIGHLQRNKVASVVGRVERIESVDSLRLIDEIERQAARLGIVQRVLLEINVGGEDCKTGAPPEELPAMIRRLGASPHLRGEGLMTVPPWSERAEDARLHFRRLRELLHAAPAGGSFVPRDLSMGMSHDFEVAIEEGATSVRIGSLLLGSRA